MQLRCKELTVVVPDMAKSAATILCLGAHNILMGPGGDLGPIDPQMIFPGEAEERIRANPGSFPLFASLLSDVNMLMVEQAKAALSRSEALMREALSVQGRTREEVDALAAKLKEPLIDAPSSHSAVISVDHATGYGLPAESADVNSEEWRLIWELWTRYFSEGCWPAGQEAIYEGIHASHPG